MLYSHQRSNAISISPNDLCHSRQTGNLGTVVTLEAVSFACYRSACNSIIRRTGQQVVLFTAIGAGPFPHGSVSITRGKRGAAKMAASSAVYPNTGKMLMGSRRHAGAGRYAINRARVRNAARRGGGAACNSGPVKSTGSDPRRACESVRRSLGTATPRNAFCIPRRGATAGTDRRTHSTRTCAAAWLSLQGETLPIAGLPALLLLTCREFIQGVAEHAGFQFRR